MKTLTIDVVPLLPGLIPIAGILLVLVVDLVAPRLRTGPYAVGVVASLGAAIAAMPGTRLGGGSTKDSFCVPPAPGSVPVPGLEGLNQLCFWQAGALASGLQVAAGLAAAVCFALAWPRRERAHAADHASRDARRREPTREPIEVVLLLTALVGTVTVAAARDLGTWLISLELATLPVVALVALRGTRAAVAGAVQLLVTSLVSFAMLALGAALWLYATGSPMLTATAVTEQATGAPGTGSSAVLGLAVLLMLAGLGFKLSLVPFHAWTPTAYAGSPTAVAAFLSTVSKIAALAGLIVVLHAMAAVGRPGLIVIAVLAIASMTVGNVMALRQDDVVRLLAWSTVAQAGWVVMPLVSISAAGAKASAAYLLTYVIATLVAFAVVTQVVRERGRAGRTMAAYGGLWHRNPWQAGALALALTSLAGLPPGIIGLVGKVVALRPVLSDGWILLGVLAAANVVLGVAVYLRWLRPVITVDPSESTTPDAAPRRSTVRRPVIVVGLLTTLVLVVASVQPDLILRLLG